MDKICKINNWFNTGSDTDKEEILYDTYFIDCLKREEKRKTRRDLSVPYSCLKYAWSVWPCKCLARWVWGFLAVKGGRGQYCMAEKTVLLFQVYGFEVAGQVQRGCLELIFALESCQRYLQFGMRISFNFAVECKAVI